MRTLLLVAALAVGVAGLAAEPEQTTFETYSIGFADPRAAEDTVRAIVGPGGSVVLDERGQRLLVVTTPQRHSQVAQVVRKLSVPPKNVRIDVRFRSQGERRASGASLGVKGQVSRIEGISHTTIRMKPQVENTTITESAGTVQSLVVLSGRAAQLRVGESVPYVEWLVDYGLNCGVLHERVSWQKVGSFLVVEPMVVGDGPMIRVRLTPELSGMVAGSPYHLRFAGAATEIVAVDGQTFQLGSSDENQEFYSRFLIGFDRAGTQQALDISMTAHILRGPTP